MVVTSAPQIASLPLLCATKIFDQGPSPVRSPMTLVPSVTLATWPASRLRCSAVKPRRRSVGICCSIGGTVFSTFRPNDLGNSPPTLRTPGISIHNHRPVRRWAAKYGQSYRHARIKQSPLHISTHSASCFPFPGVRVASRVYSSSRDRAIGPSCLLLKRYSRHTRGRNRAINICSAHLGQRLAGTSVNLVVDAVFRS